MVVIKNTTQIYTTVNEDKTINECFEVINGIMAQMCSCDCDEMQSLATGEVVTVDDLRRVLGVLDGLPHMGIMYKTEWSGREHTFAQFARPPIVRILIQNKF